MLVKDLMTTTVTSIPPDSPVASAIKIMRSEDVGIVPVCDVQRHLLGVITDRDILMRDGFNKNAEDVMSTNVVSAAPKDDIHDAALKMSQHGVRRLPVIENEKLTGMLSIKDLAGKKIFTAEIGHIMYIICNKKTQHD